MLTVMPTRINHPTNVNILFSGFVTREEDWKYSSARDFYGMKGLVELSYS